MNQYVVALLSTGGAAFLTAIFMGLKSIRDGRQANEESLIKRINDDAKKARDDVDVQRMRATRAEAERELMRKERDEANDLAARYRRLLIENDIRFID